MTKVNAIIDDSPVCKESDCVGGSVWTQPTSSFLLNIRRYRFHEPHSCQACPLFKINNAVESFFHLMFFTLAPNIVSTIMPFFQFIRKRTQGFCQHVFRKVLKAVTGLVKLGGPYITKSWRYLCYWEASLGYTPYRPLSDLKPDVEAWLVNPHINGEGMGTDVFHHKLYDATCEFLRKEWKRPSNPPTLKQWLEKAAWMRGRGGTGNKSTILIDNKRVKTRSNKGVDAIFLNDEALAREMFTVIPQKMVIMQKSEPAKIRPVAKADNQLFRKMDFLSEIVEFGLMGSKRSSLFLGPVGNERLDLHILDHIQHGINVPLDQGSFDNNQGKPSILVVLLAIYDVCLAQEENHEYQKVWAAMWDSFVHPDSKVILGEDSFPWHNGVASGWRWTAFIDTILNIATYDVLTKYVSQYTGATFYDSVHQGDDIHFKCDTLGGVQTLINAYKDNGYEVHASKTYASTTRTEFLRRSYEKCGVLGYYCRSLQGLLYRNPITEQTILPASRIYDRITVALLMVLRGGSPRGIAQWIREDASQLHVSDPELSDFILTPSAVGGVGMSGASGPLASEFLSTATGMWTIPRSEETSRPRCIVDLGQWNGRLQRVGVILDQTNRNNFLNDLVRTWGIRTTDVSGDFSFFWEKIKPFAPLPITGGMDLPPPSDIWADEKVPTMLRQHWKNQLIKDGTWTNHVKPEHLEQLKRLRKRISAGLFEDYLLGTVREPVPVVDGVALKYGQGWKQQAKQWMLRALSSNLCDRKIFEKKMLWLESLAIRHISRLRLFGTLAL
ncbi:hypothetical protein 2 [Sanxia water strider virus 20]|uniref:RNA-directed RNA polymerase n=1 Tax=Sanxia water strider virus 20 TaxID=1923404 RepID=A0A1L3KF97_9VIRU|nr:hypothetical protein 2 [Sanxia water strider virus 20]APG76035.1 hypothetical protein 2 [Sanxia water strider virus 20]